MVRKKSQKCVPLRTTSKKHLLCIAFICIFAVWKTLKNINGLKAIGL
jgi:hypothetical protein